MTTMQTRPSMIAVERMLESADRWAGRHGRDPSIPVATYPTPHLPAGWILYSACYAFSRRATDQAKKGWTVTLLGTSGPFQKNSMVNGSNPHSLDAALLDASRKITAARAIAQA